MCLAQWCMTDVMLLHMRLDPRLLDLYRGFIHDACCLRRFAVTCYYVILGYEGNPIYTNDREDIFQRFVHARIAVAKNQALASTARAQMDGSWQHTLSDLHWRSAEGRTFLSRPESHERNLRGQLLFKKIPQHLEPEFRRINRFWT